MKRWLQRPNEYYPHFVRDHHGSDKVSPVSGAAAGGHVFLQMLLWYFHLAGSLFWPPPTQSRPIAFLCYSRVGTAVLWVADLLTLQTGRALTAAGLRCSYYVTHYSTHPSPPFPAGSATTRRSGINKLSAASASPTRRPASVVIQPTTETRP